MFRSAYLTNFILYFPNPLILLILLKFFLPPSADQSHY